MPSKPSDYSYDYEFSPLPDETNLIPGTSLQFTPHHAIPQEVFDKSPFLRALQANGLWSQGGGDLRTNMAPLLRTIDGRIASGRTNTGIWGTCIFLQKWKCPRVSPRAALPLPHLKPRASAPHA